MDARYGIFKLNSPFQIPVEREPSTLKYKSIMKDETKKIELRVDLVKQFIELAGDQIKPSGFNYVEEFKGMNSVGQFEASSEYGHLFFAYVNCLFIVENQHIKPFIEGEKTLTQLGSKFFAAKDPIKFIRMSRLNQEKHLILQEGDKVSIYDTAELAGLLAGLKAPFTQLPLSSSFYRLPDSLYVRQVSFSSKADESTYLLVDSSLTLHVISLDNGKPISSREKVITAVFNQTGEFIIAGRDATKDHLQVLDKRTLQTRNTIHLTFADYVTFDFYRPFFLSDYCDNNIMLFASGFENESKMNVPFGYMLIFWIGANLDEQTKLQQLKDQMKIKYCFDTDCQQNSDEDPPSFKVEFLGNPNKPGFYQGQAAMSHQDQFIFFNIENKEIQCIYDYVTADKPHIQRPEINGEELDATECLGTCLGMGLVRTKVAGYPDVTTITLTDLEEDYVSPPFIFYYSLDGRLSTYKIFYTKWKEDLLVKEPRKAIPQQAKAAPTAPVQQQLAKEEAPKPTMAMKYPEEKKSTSTEISQIGTKPTSSGMKYPEEKAVSAADLASLEAKQPAASYGLPGTSYAGGQKQSEIKIPENSKADMNIKPEIKPTDVKPTSKQDATSNSSLFGGSGGGNFPIQSKPIDPSLVSSQVSEALSGMKGAGQKGPEAFPTSSSLFGSSSGASQAKASMMNYSSQQAMTSSMGMQSLASQFDKSMQEQQTKQSPPLPQSKLGQAMPPLPVAQKQEEPQMNAFQSYIFLIDQKLTEKYNAQVVHKLKSIQTKIPTIKDLTKEVSRSFLDPQLLEKLSMDTASNWTQVKQTIVNQINTFSQLKYEILTHKKGIDSLIKEMSTRILTKETVSNFFKLRIGFDNFIRGNKDILLQDKDYLIEINRKASQAIKDVIMLDAKIKVQENIKWEFNQGARSHFSQNEMQQFNAPKTSQAFSLTKAKEQDNSHLRLVNSNSGRQPQDIAPNFVLIYFQAYKKHLGQQVNQLENKMQTALKTLKSLNHQRSNMQEDSFKDCSSTDQVSDESSKEEDSIPDYEVIAPTLVRDKDRLKNLHRDLLETFSSKDSVQRIKCPSKSDIDRLIKKEFGLAPPPITTQTNLGGLDEKKLAAFFHKGGQVQENEERQQFFSSLDKTLINDESPLKAQPPTKSSLSKQNFEEVKFDNFSLQKKPNLTASLNQFQQPSMSLLTPTKPTTQLPMGLADENEPAIKKIKKFEPQSFLEKSKPTNLTEASTNLFQTKPVDATTKTLSQAPTTGLFAGGPKSQIPVKETEGEAQKQAVDQIKQQPPVVKPENKPPKPDSIGSLITQTKVEPAKPQGQSQAQPPMAIFGAKPTVAMNQTSSFAGGLQGAPSFGGSLLGKENQLFGQAQAQGVKSFGSVDIASIAAQQNAQAPKIENKVFGQGSMGGQQFSSFSQGPASFSQPPATFGTFSQPAPQVTTFFQQQPTQNMYQPTFGGGQGNFGNQGYSQEVEFGTAVGAGGGFGTGSIGFATPPPNFEEAKSKYQGSSFMKARK